MKKIKVRPCQASHPSRVGAGFGLLETMLFLFVVGALIVVGFAWLAAKKQTERAEQTTAQLQQANRFVEAFAATNFRLPCPAATPTGVEDCSRAKGFIPYQSLGLDASAAQVGAGYLHYVVNPVLTPTASNSFEPRKWDGTPHDFMQISSVDYCRRLTAANAAPTGAQVRNGAGVLRPVAYAIAHPGKGDADGNGSALDGANAASTATLEAPENGLITGVYDDSVLARSTAELSFNADCSVLISTLDMMALGVDVTDEVFRARVVALATASLLGVIALVKSGITIYKITEANTALAGASAALTAATAELAAAIVLCAVAVGCLAIPHAAAVVAAATAAVVAGGLAVGLGIAALVPLATFTAAVLTVAVLAGVSLIPNIDLSLVIANARDSLAAARANRINANGQLVTIQANAAPRLAIQSSALAALYGEANNPTTGIVATANGLGAPAGTAPLNALDTIIADAVISQRALSDAAFNVSAAGDELRRAQEAVPIDAAVVANRQALLASAIIALPTAIIAFGTQRQALIDASRREYCAPGCGLFYDGRAGMTAAFDAYVNAANDAFIDTKKLQLAQQNYDAALLAEQEAQAALDQLLAANTSPTAGAATPITVWSGAEGILRRADALGGTR